MKLSKKKIIPVGIAILIVLATVGTVGALNGWFGGGASIPADTMTRGLVGYWPMDEGSGTTTYDVSGNNSNGTLYNNPSWATGKKGNALSFDGKDDYVYVPSSSNFVSSQGSIEAWFYVVSGEKGNYGHEIVIYGGDENNAIVINYDTSSNRGIGAFSRWGGEAWPYHWQGGTASNAFLLDTWNHVVLVQDGKAPKIYVNGKLAATISAGNNLTTWTDVSSAQSYIFSYRPYSSIPYYFKGSIDEVKIYNRALSAEEIINHYNHGGPVAQWSFDEGSGSVLYDKTENNNDGTIYGGMATSTAATSGWKSGKYGTALAFDGVDDYASVPTTTNSVLDITSAITIEAWFNANTFSDWKAIVSKSPSYTQNKGYELFLGATQAGAKIGSTSFVEPSYPYSLKTGQWYHYVFTWDGKYYDFYLNGMRFSHTANSPTPTASTENLLIGKSNSGAGINPFNGLIDDVRIYNYTRTPDEIRLDYNAGFAARFGPVGKTCSEDPASCMTKGLVGYWSMDEGAGTITYDGSGNNNNGTLTNLPSWTKGKTGSGLSFDGKNDYVGVANSSSLYFYANQSYSWEFWVKPGKDKWMSIIYKHAGGVKGWRIEENTNFAICFVNDKDYTSVCSSSNIFSLNTWSHVVITYGGNKTDIRLFVNGAEKSFGDFTTDFVDDTADSLLIGGGYNPEAYNGSIDEVRIYNRALSAEEVRYHYNGGDPVAYWKFDEGSGTTTYDGTENNNDGTIYGGMATSTTASSGWKSGKYGTALSFDGVNDYVDCGRQSSLYNLENGNFTVEAWIYPMAHISADGSRYTIVAFYNPGWMVDLVRDTGNEGYRFYTGTAAETYYTGGLNLPLKWQHIVWTVDSSYFTFYLDGVQKTKIAKAAITASTGNFRIGKRSDGQYMNGLIDDVRIYNYARTPAEIRLDYNAGYAARFGSVGASCEIDPASCMTKGLVGYWNMDEGAGTTTYDGSGNNNSGTLASGPSWTKGKTGGALSFDGKNDYVDAGSGASLNTNVWTREMWIKKLTNSGLYENLLSSGAPWGYNQLYIVPTTNIIEYMWQEDGGSYRGVWGARSISTVPLNQWIYVAVTDDGSYIRLYFNGVLEGTSDNHSGYLNPSFNYVNIGRGRNSDGTQTYQYNFNGLIDDVRIYNRALSAEEIRYHYNRGGPVAQWSFDEGSGSVLYDKTENNNDGTIYGGMATSTADGSGWKSGKYGTALAFDGVDDYVSAGTNPITATSTFTLSGWLKPGTHSTYGVAAIIGNAGAGQSAWIGWCAAAQSGTSNSIGGGFFGTNYGSGISDNNWHYVTLTFGGGAGGKALLYVDGILKVNTTATPNFASTAIMMGKANTGTAYWYNGLVDDVRIYNYARTPVQILQDYNSGYGTYFK